MTVKSEKIIICGKSGAGKDFLLKGLAKEGLRSSTKFTTRPKRKYEVDGIDYHFVNENFFQLEDFIVRQEFKNSEGNIWRYGISLKDFESSQSFIMTPGEISQIDAKTRKNCFVVYLDIDREVREERIKIRNDNNDSVKRRLDSDDVDFRDFKDYDLKITDPEFDIESILNLMN